MDRHQMTFTVCSECQAILDILPGQFGKILHDFLLGHARGQIRKDVRNRDPHPSDARLTTALSCFDRDDLGVIHLVKGYVT